jgi:uncharacterized protein
MPAPVTRRIALEREIRVPMRDGETLLADHYAPLGIAEAATVLVRTPYGRGGPVGLLCQALAERGFHVVVVSCRGTFGSGGTFEPLLDERADGLDTVDWLGKQDWYDGRLLTYGPSYAGITQWAIAADTRLTAMSTVVTASEFGGSTYAGGAFSLDSVLTWSALLAAQRLTERAGSLDASRPRPAPFAGARARVGALVELLRGQPRLKRGLAHHPLSTADTVAIGAEVGFMRRWLVERDPAGDYWGARGHFNRLADISAPVLMIGGWYDIFLPWQLDDYIALRAAGRRPYLIVGPWHHGSFGLVQRSAAESIAWFRHHASGAPYPAAPVRIHVGGADEWREYDDWPVSAAGLSLVLGAGGLEPDGPTAFTYDPADPTPSLGGPRLVGNVAGRRDNGPLEARPDVVTYTGPVLDAPVEVIGPVSATIVVRADAPHFDVFVRLCDVGPDGRSWNVCDGLTRVSGETEAAVSVRLWPTAYQFRAGHRIRVQVSGGCHPRFARNPGTGAALDADGELRPVRREILPGSSLRVG